MRNLLCTLLLATSFLVPQFALAYVKPPPKVASLITRVAKAYGVKPQTAMAVAWCESRYSETAKHYNYNGTYDVGLFQINDVHIPTLERLGLTRYDYTDNATFAMKLISQDGLSDFSSSSSCWGPLLENTA